ncbi:hypothetical protein J4E93_006516 [Alternaria ventricosa]|uniref:uncharacterized protein n=1 Tax=Alternaria ventricosa TaxID=1187951 RepID=UPI0020C22A3B|nr:uncharacterized protein J4E93_006516 [Alternaria ventricosa]KAI4643506.1 hypothetical protein J4E93_006516 [Alternaria ventricosa]
MADLNHQLTATTEEIQALVLLHSQFLWHGSQQQRQQVRDEHQLLQRVSSSGTSTPRSQGDSPATPPNGVNEQIQNKLRSTVGALSLWKACWDKDLAIQFTQNQRRRGFCRDGIHFYFLAQAFLRQSRPDDWAAPADVRCRHVFNLLKQIRHYVASDSAQKGIEIGSMVAIADDYAIADLTLNMKRLFTPLDEI